MYSTQHFAFPVPQLCPPGFTNCLPLEPHVNRFSGDPFFFFSPRRSCFFLSWRIQFSPRPLGSCSLVFLYCYFLSHRCRPRLVLRARGFLFKRSPIYRSCLVKSMNPATSTPVPFCFNSQSKLPVFFPLLCFSPLFLLIYLNLKFGFPVFVACPVPPGLHPSTSCTVRFKFLFSFPFPHCCPVKSRVLVDPPPFAFFSYSYFVRAGGFLDFFFLS